MAVPHQGSIQGLPVYITEDLSLELTCSVPDLLKCNFGFVTVSSAAFLLFS